MTIDALFTPTRLGSIQLANRVVMAPLTRSRASTMAVPADFAANYYGQRASAGLIVTEATQVSFEGMGYCRTPGMHSAEQIAAWTRIVDAVHARGGRIAVQLWHVGRIASSLNRGVAADIVAPSAVRAPGQMWTDQNGMVEHDQPRALETAEIARVANDFAMSARAALRAGFDGIELHSANGYLLHQFLSSNVNQRTDRYGGSIDNRVRMPLEVLEAILAEVPADKVGVRISPGHTFNGIEERDVTALYEHYIRRLDTYGLAYLHVMRPFANQTGEDVVTMARGLYRGSLLACGNYGGADAAALIASGGAQAVAFGRSYISNPDLVDRLRQGRTLAEPDQTTFYTPGEKGYTDYPVAA